VLASYIARYVFKALSDMFHGAHEIQAWLGETGGRICTALLPDQIRKIAETNSPPPKTKTRCKTAAATPPKSLMDDLTSKFKSTIVWTTPLRMPVAQPYRKSAVKVVKTCIQDLSLTIPTTADPVNRRKQLQAFPPNFIHSLDASHMMLSALQCDDNGLTFAAVHDSFWTHAADVDVMNNILRDCFVRIHGEDVIGRLAAEFEARYQGSIYMAKVKQTSAVGKKVMAWRKENKMSFKDELLLENERQKLLRSSDTEEVARGKEMETPASIFEAQSETDSLVAPDGAEEIGLGKITESDPEIEPTEDGLKADDASADEEEVEMDWLQRTLQNYNKSPFQMRVEGGAPAKKQKAPAKTTPIWLPLTLPPVPEKGDFDVRKLKSSQYFFS
jgi:DNA-directed RNA polymerase